MQNDAVSISNLGATVGSGSYDEVLQKNRLWFDTPITQAFL